MDFRALLSDTDALRHQIAEQGHLFLPGFLDRQRVLEVRGALLKKLAERGAIDLTFPLMDGVSHPDYNDIEAHQLTRQLPELDQLLYTGHLMHFFTGLLGGPVRHYDYTWLRVLAPGRGTFSHCDVVYMGRGTKNLLTAWTPLGDIDSAMGGLMILEGSHDHRRLRETYGNKDVDEYCQNRPGAERVKAMANRTGALCHDPNQLRRSLGGRWLNHEYRAGDVVIFNVYMVHCGLDNQTNRLRLSSDSRYQLASEPLDERWNGPNPVAHGPAGKRGKIC